MVRSHLIVHTPLGNRGTECSECLVNPDVEQFTLMWSRPSVLEILIGVLVDIQTVCNGESVQ